MAVERLPELGKLGNAPVELHIKLPPVKIVHDHLGDGLRDLFRRSQLCDMSLEVAGRTFQVHRAVLAAQSSVFRERLLGQTVGATNISLSDINNPEAVQFMLDHLYGLDLTDSYEWRDYNPRTQEINKDVLRLAKTFQLPSLTQRAQHYLAKDMTTGNVVERLAICEEFDLSVLHGKILTQLTSNKKAMMEVASSPQIMSYPQLMKQLLERAAAAEEVSQPVTKKARKKQ